jgi:hypothetical protein
VLCQCRSIGIQTRWSERLTLFYLLLNVSFCHSGWKPEGGLNGGAKLLLLSALDCVQEGGATCTYLKGKDKRTICIVQNCSMSSHKNAGSEKRFAFGEGEQGVLVIQTGPDVALAKPTARPGLFGAGLERYLKER